MAKILILGGGFGGLIVAERLEIKLVATNKNLHFTRPWFILFGECDVEDHI